MTFSDLNLHVANLRPEERSFLLGAVAAMADPEQSAVRPRLLRGDASLTMRDGRPVIVDRIGAAEPVTIRCPH